MVRCWGGFWPGECVGGIINESCPCGGRKGLLGFTIALRLAAGNGLPN